MIALEFCEHKSFSLKLYIVKITAWIYTVHVPGIPYKFGIVIEIKSIKLDILKI